MRTPTRILAAAVAAALSLGLVATTADAASHTATKKDDGVKATLVVHDIKNKLGKVVDKHWLTLTVKTPATAHDVVDGHDYGALAVHWYARLTITGAPACTTTITSNTYEHGSGRWVLPVNVTTKRPTTTTLGSYLAAGACKVKAEVTAYRYAQNPKLDVNAHFFVKTAAAIQNDVRTTKPHASATSVKKHHSVSLSGTVTYQKATATVAYRWRAAPSGSKVVVQFRAKGSSTWKNVKATKVTVTRSGSYRVRSLPTTTRQSQASAAVAIRAR